MIRRLSARGPATVYEAGTSPWSSDGKVTTVPRASLEPFCADSTLPDDSGAAYVLTSSKDVVSLKFNGTGIALYGITFARDSCEVGINPTIVTLDVGAPPGAPSNTATTSATATTGGPQPTCDSFPTPVAACNTLLAQWVGLDSRNRYRLSVSTSGQQVAVLNAHVLLEPAVSPSPIPSATPPISRPGVHPGTTDTPLSLPASLSSPSSLTVSSESTPGLSPDDSSFSISQSSASFSDPSSSKTLRSENPDAPTDPSSLLSASHSDTERIIIPAVLVPLAALAFILGFLYVRWRKRCQHALPRQRELEPPHEGSSRPGPEPSQWTSTASLGNDSQRDPHLSMKHRDVKMLFRPMADPPRGDHAGSLRQAIEDAGLRTEDVVVSLNRLREQARGGQSDRTAPPHPSPPRYDD